MSNLSEADIQKIASAVAQKVASSQAIGHDQASNIAAAAARTAVQEMTSKGLAMLGIDPANSKHIESLKANLSFVQSLRLKADRVGQSMTNAITNAVTYGFMILLVIGFFWWARGHGSPSTPLPK
jgi:hypothetical protein